MFEYRPIVLVVVMAIAASSCGGDGESLSPHPTSTTAATSPAATGNGKSEPGASVGASEPGASEPQQPSRNDLPIDLGPPFAPGAGIDFGEAEVGTESPLQLFEIINVDDEAEITITHVTISGVDPSDFRIVEDSCNAPRVLTPGAQCNVTIVFAPTEAGSRIADFGLGTEPLARGGFSRLRGTGITGS